MSRYGQYQYYDPVGSNQPQPTGYTYQSTSNAPSYPSAAASSGYGNNQQNYGSSGYGAQSYGNTAQPSTATNHAAAALSSMGNQDYSQTSNRSASGQYDHSQWYGSSATPNYGTSALQPPNRSQANNSPLYASTQSSTFGRLSVPDQPQNTSSSYGNSSTYQNAPSSAGTNYRYQSNTTQPPQNPPQRYNSPLHAVQAQQQSHQKQSSRGSNHQPSPQMANAPRYAQQQSRQQSASVEPSPTTVDPSQVYDNRAELERKARFDAERRRKIEAEQAAKKAEEDRLAAEQQKAEEANRKATEAAEAAKKKEQQDRRNEQRRKAREEKRQSKSAATTLQQMASMGAESSAAGGEDDEEAQMRAMFKKMREFNSKNPAMLAKLWEEERRQHSDSQSPQAAEKTTPAPAPKAASPKHSSGPAIPGQQKSAAQPPKTQNQKQPAAQQSKAAATSQASPQATPSRSASTSAGTSLWPPHKKGALADATAKWLMGLPGNVGKTISQQAVLNILDSNPSYVQLCESLENLDMKFERSTLARELLKAVPDGLRPQQKPLTPGPTTNGTGTPASAPQATPQANQSRPQSASGKARTASGSGMVSYEAPLSLMDAAREVNDMHKSQQAGAAKASVSPHPNQSKTLTNASRPPSQTRAASQSQPPEVKPDIRPEEPPRPPANKEEAARKRTFGDLVDLTKDDDSDDEQPPPKKFFQQSSTGPLASDVATIYHDDPLTQSQQQQGWQQTNKPYQYRPNQKNLPGGGSMQPPQRPQHILPSNHPPQQPQQTPPVAPKPKGPSAEQLQQSRMRGRMLVEPIMRDRVARKSKYDSNTIARDVLLATGRHPDMRGLNAHLNNMQKLLGHHGAEVDTAGSRCDLSTVRWDIIDPEQPKENEKPSEQKSPDPLALPTGPRLAPKPAQTPTTTVNYESPFSANYHTLGRLGERKKGRPPKSKSKPRAFMPEGSTGNTLTQPLGERGDRASPNAKSSPLPPRQLTPTDPALLEQVNLLEQANSMAASGTPVGYSAFRQIGPDGQVIKKKGRPVGWRKSVHSREAQGLPPSYPKKEGGSAGKKLGGASKHGGEKPLVEPSWQTFHCEWKGCKAELQNLDTLKKHLVKVHGREMEGGRGFQCLWKGCDRQPGEAGGFAEMEEWMSHMDGAHVSAVAWKLGDGPTGGRAGDSPFARSSKSPGSPAYLNDRFGRSVTPVIKPTPPPSDTHQTQVQAQPSNSAPSATTTLPIHPAADPAPKRIGRPPLSATENSAGAELRKLEAVKRQVGVTMGRSGCVLASEERRRTFLGDEDFENEVQAGSEDEGEGLWER